MFALVHIGVFEFYSDYSICELNTMGFIVIGICVINTVLSTVFLKKRKKLKVVCLCIVSIVEKA